MIINTTTTRCLNRGANGSSQPMRKSGTTVNQSTVPFTIVVPARNEEKTLADVLEVVRTMTDDLIVVDGHSSDSTVAIAEKFGAKLVQDNGPYSDIYSREISDLNEHVSDCATESR